ncbi:MAG: hypothetical protein BGO98_38795 [Myxococcales bacterium 68-20]|nr:MAG: hypothetical protein BGO98_38795 [Myxococcales bacterium 68-20]
MRKNYLSLALLLAAIAVSCGDSPTGDGASPDQDAGDAGSSDDAGSNDKPPTCGVCDPVATCNDKVDPATCICPNGYTDTKGDGSVCSDVDECANGAHDCDANVGVCTNTPGGFACACPAGYTDTKGDGSVCSDIDECATGAHDCDANVGVCTNTPGGVACACPAGYTDTKGDGSVCSDVDECATGAHDCDANVGVCTNTPGSFACACPAGYHDKNGNGTLCEPLALYSASPFQGFLFQNETVALTTVGCLPITLPGSTVSGTNAMTRHPVTGTVYAVLKVQPDRILATLDLATGVATSIGTLGERFSALAFTPDGATLYGVTGDGSPTPETLFTIDPQTAARTQIQTLGNGADGEVIAFDGAGTLYHWSGNGTVVTETIQIGAGTTAVDFPVIGETFGAVWWSWHKDTEGNPDPVFLLSTISSNFRTLSPAKGYSAAFGSTPDDVRGLVFDRNHGYVRGASACPVE